MLAEGMVVGLMWKMHFVDQSGFLMLFISQRR